jgi:hypothetical protein
MPTLSSGRSSRGSGGSGGGRGRAGGGDTRDTGYGRRRRRHSLAVTGSAAAAWTQLAGQG